MTSMRCDERSRTLSRLLVTTAIGAALAMCGSCSRFSAPTPRIFQAPEEAVQALNEAVKKSRLDEFVAIFGADANDLIDSSDPIAASRRREVFAIAMAEGWRLVDEGPRKTLVVGNEAWPFPVPLAHDARGWRFDTAAGKEEVLARRIGRNELAAIQISRTYVAAQRAYARHGHDGKPAGLYARVFRSDPDRQNGLYWPSVHGQPRSPLGDLLPRAAEERPASGSARERPSPFYGYHFRILTAQGGTATGGARDYVVNGDMSGGFALVAWPAQYDVTGVMTFVVNHDAVVYEKDFGSGTEAAVKSLTLFDPDASWSAIN
jgi:Protein of unknown function (DUF2950)